MSEQTENSLNNNTTKEIENNNDSLSKEKKTSEISEFIKLINELKLKIKEVKGQLASISKRIKNNEIKTNQGVSLLEIKYHTLLEYITSLTFIIYMKLNGQSIQNHPVIENLIELRIVLEKLKPLEQKLKYQIDKLIRATVINDDDDVKLTNTSGNSLALSDPLSFKPNPQNLVSKFDDTNDDDNTNTGVYKAPKLVPVHFEEDGGVKSKREKEESRSLSRASKSRLIKDLINEYDDRPEESTIIGSTQNNDNVELEERLNYEEENFIRLNLSKKDLKKFKKSRRLEDEFENLNDFNSIAALHQDVEASEKERTNVLSKRNARRELLHHQDISDDDVEVSSSKRGGNKNKELFNGLISDSLQIKKRNNKFQMAKRNFKRQKRK
ncbi:Sas10/Utp3/C1D family-domain-containing protein [Glomus cerebriforme]|uniref:Sas10/Utp3/C1D family-domain-containing protein n=1 Tax=Glomus cerebriforme TaxID=658196 RepID=A0A397SSR8_9GLOM|nr:Sas10/Utp3/C1D family-domain-containing protein [Glomus cerebriforme]